jgi:hypothetical protein
VDVSSKKYSFLFKDKDYSVLDYELMGDNILLLIFRNQLKRSELVLLDRSGDTLAVSKLPEVPPAVLFRDFLSNVHYFTKSGNSYQCFFNEKSNQIDFLYKTTVDSITKLVRPFIFKMSGRLYFQENIANGFGTAIGYYQEGSVKKYIRQFINEKKVSDYGDDQKFYAGWNNLINQTNKTAFGLQIGGKFFDEYEARSHQVFYLNTVYPVIKTGENKIAFFNFGEDMIELMNEDGKIINTAPVTFHQEARTRTDSTHSIKLSNAGWRWGNTLLVDGYNRRIYAGFRRNGMVRLQPVDPETGKVSKGTTLPFPFPEKIEIYKGDAYFLIKRESENENWKLVKCRL